MYRPDIHDFFPKVRRGHGTTHPYARVKDGVTVRKACRCVAETCSLLRRQDGEKVKGEPHEDPAANAADWKQERGFNKDLPLELCR